MERILYKASPSFNNIDIPLVQPQAHLYNASFVLPCLLFLLSIEYKLTSCVVERLGKHSQDWDNGVQKVSLFQITLNIFFLFLIFEHHLSYFAPCWFRQSHLTEVGQRKPRFHGS